MSGKLVITRYFCEHSVSYFCMSREYFLKKATLEKKSKLSGFCESAKSRAWRACVLGVLTCLRAHVLGVLTCLRAHGLGVLTCLRARSVKLLIALTFR